MYLECWIPYSRLLCVNKGTYDKIIKNVKKNIGLVSLLNTLP